MNLDINLTETVPYLRSVLFLAVQRNILHHCFSQSGYIMTVSLDRKDHLFTDYLISIQFD